MENYKDIGLSWKPWIGKKYYEGGIFKKKIVLLGESHYGSENDTWFNEELTRLTIQEKIGEAPDDAIFSNKAFHTNIFYAFNDLPKSNENLKQFWHSVSFFNYVQNPVGTKARIRPKKEDWKLSYEPVRKTLEFLDPDIIVVLGYQLWDNIWREFDSINIIRTDFNNGRNIHEIALGNQPFFFSIKHPSSAFSSRYFRPFLTKFIISK